MRYNSKSISGLIDKAKASGKKVKTTTIEIDEIRRTQTKSGHWVITLVAKDGQLYSAFERIWLAQSIDMDALHEGDQLEVAYVTNGDFKNFLQVTVAQQLPF